MNDACKHRPSLHKLEDKIFGRWTVVSYVGKRKEEHFWICRCECGVEKQVAQRGLLHGGSKGCSSCHHKELTIKKQKNRDLIGKQFGKWTVLTYLGELRHGHKYWLCRCECGTEREVFESNLVTGKSISCKGTGCAPRKHGMTETRVYSIWENMISRCENSNNFSYYLYGARGIKVCERWKSFENFYSDMGDPPEKYSIDRIDPNLGYCPENCRWASSMEQSKNKTGVRRRMTVSPNARGSF